MTCRKQFSATNKLFFLVLLGGADTFACHGIHFSALSCLLGSLVLCGASKGCFGHETCRKQFSATLHVIDQSEKSRNVMIMEGANERSVLLSTRALNI